MIFISNKRKSITDRDSHDDTVHIHIRLGTWFQENIYFNCCLENIWKKWKNIISKQQKMLICSTLFSYSCIIFVQCWTNVQDVGPTLYKCYTSLQNCGEPPRLIDNALGLKIPILCLEGSVIWLTIFRKSSRPNFFSVDLIEKKNVQKKPFSNSSGRMLGKHAGYILNR